MVDLRVCVLCFWFGLVWFGFRLVSSNAIFFVFCIFLFIFKEGGPFLWNEVAYTLGSRDLESEAGKTETLPAVVGDRKPERLSVTTSVVLPKPRSTSCTP